MLHALPNGKSGGFPRNRKIAIVVPCLHIAGGSVRIATWMANRFAELNDVVLVSCESFSKLAFEADARVRTCSLDLDNQRVINKVLNGCAPLSRVLNEFDVDMLFAIGTYEALISLIPAKKKGVPVVFCDHGALINQWHDVKMRVIRWIDAHFSSRTVTLTEKSANDYIRLLGVSESKISCIPNPISKDFGNAEGSYDPSAKRILWAGRLSEEKGVDLLLEIASRVLPSRPDWIWNVYGEIASEKYASLDDEIEGKGLSAQLLIKGHAGNMLDVYRSHSIGVLTSLREGLPLFLLEGKACGLPLVSFDVDTGPRDILTDGEDGFLIDCFDVEDFSHKLGKLMDDRNMREKMSAQTLQTVDRFSEEVIFEKWSNLACALLL